MVTAAVPDVKPSGPNPRAEKYPPMKMTIRSPAAEALKPRRTPRSIRTKSTIQRVGRCVTLKQTKVTTPRSPNRRNCSSAGRCENLLR